MTRVGSQRHIKKTLRAVIRWKIRFEPLTAVKIEFVAFLFVAPCCLVGGL